MQVRLISQRGIKLFWILNIFCKFFHLQTFKIFNLLLIRKYTRLNNALENFPCWHMMSRLKEIFPAACEMTDRMTNYWKFESIVWHMVLDKFFIPSHVIVNHIKMCSWPSKSYNGLSIVENLGEHPKRMKVDSLFNMKWTVYFDSFSKQCLVIGCKRFHFEVVQFIVFHDII